MAAPPPKRQRKLVVLSSSDNEDETLSFGGDDRSPEGKVARPPTSSRRQEQRPINSPTKTRATRPRKPASNTNSKKRKETATDANQTSPRSLHKFFQPATEEQRWAALKPPAAATAIPRQEEHPDEIEDDLIEDDEYGSFDDDIFEHLTGKDTAAKLPSRPRQQQQQPQKSSDSRKRAQPSKPQRSKRFILDDFPVSAGTETRPEATDRRPWPERYAPSNIEELAVHKKKVADVRSWLTAAFSGRTKHKILVLHGPAGSGKTTTISLLSRALGFSIVEWKSPVGTESADGKYNSLNAQFDEFLNRSDGFGSLDLTDSPSTSTTTTHEPQGSASQRIILIEEFPNSLSWGSSSLSAFRTSLRRYLASDSPLSHGPRTTPPVVIVISETRLATSASMSDNLTMHRLLGPEIYTNPGASTIEFNPIAPTFMRKALDLILKKEARDSMRQRIPGPGVLKKFSELGDVRSAISSLQFFCLRGDKDGDWGGRVAAKAKSASRGDTSLTLMEKDSLEIITQRESSLGLFHAVGKVVYNKREDMETPEQQRDYVAPPPHLQHLERPKISLVSIEDLINETGTDIQTFTAALHENYPPSCDGPSFTDTLNACIEHLSDSDLLGSEGRSSLSSSRMGIGMARSQFQGYGTSVDRLRQDEVSFHVAVRGLLFSLPCPVRRKLEGGSTGKRSGDTYKMHFPTSQRLWKDIEEMDGLVGVWERQLLDPTTIHSTASRSEGVESWKHNQMNASANDRNAGPDTPPKSMMSRQDILLHQLPYLTKILGNTSTQPRGLDRITQFKGITAPTDDIPDDMLNNDAEPSSVNEWSTDPVLPARRSGRPGFQASKKEEVHVNVQAAVENLLLSDDEIED
ncbi:uncharacterized protein TRUGW13939_01025 [Talaromyces rugulosus]|uniref:AAA+ ATPase domain-containing protein n=1 Tax=Talaromyces rugulosus TaxID=121627 RepID=A0A7H8QKC1_TALRU|nr:uncharacterized protein TRUGW13939_01025 [Talaromyces rugulosus]QKX53945.1 hypothetical protein TRUGW13939_01025 [Talaromyces rugulosus]